MKNRYFISAVLLLCSVFSALAQNFNPQVEVTNAYKAKLGETSKNELTMSVPDSLYRFDYSFDYSVFDNPFKGSYEFSPYLISMKPESRSYDGKKFLFRAGAGYSLHPEAQLVFSPTPKSNFRYSIYDDFKGFFGSYNDILCFKLSTGGYLVDNYLNRYYKGYEYTNKAGFAGKYETGNFEMSFDLKHNIIATSDTTYNHFYQAAGLDLSLGSRTAFDSGIAYGLSVKALLGQDHISYSNVLFSVGNLEAAAKANVSKQFGRRQKVQIDASMAMGKYSGIFNSSVFDLYVLPKYMITGRRFNMSLGVKVSTILSNDFTKSTDGTMHTKKSELLYPDFSISYRLPDDNLTFYASLTGGNNINTYSSILERSSFYNPVYQKTFTAMSYIGLLPSMDNTVIKYNAQAGFKGQIAEHFQYNMRGGYISYENLLMDGLLFDANSNPSRLNYVTIYEDLKAYYGEIDLQFKSKPFDFGGRIRYNKAFVGNSNPLAMTTALPAPRFKAELFARYNFVNRLYIGVQCDYQSERKAYVIIPQYIDLGADIEYLINSNISLWIKGGNLLNQTIQRTVLFAESGLWGTAGICLSF